MGKAQQPAEPDLGRFSDPALVVLTCLADGPNHGYSILQESESLRFPLSLGTLYGALNRLERLRTGRRLRHWPRWHFEGRALRLAGAYCLVGDLLVGALAVTRNDGFAFLLFALLALALAATTQVVRSRRPGI